jgi:nucleoside-diphosphate-sugar epimerase
MKVLITGSEGFVGKNLVRFLRERHVEVITLDCTPGADICYRLGEFEDLASSLNSHADGVEAVVHLAGSYSPFPRDICQDNVLGTTELFDTLRGIKSVQRIIILSSAEVRSDGIDRSESRSHSPATLFGATKAAQELLASVYVTSLDLPVITVRSVNIFGPGQTNGYLPRLIECAKRGVGVNLRGVASRQWVYIDHVCDFLNVLCVAPFVPPGTLVHLTGTDPIQDGLLAHAVYGMVGANPGLVVTRPEPSRSSALDRTEDTERWLLPSYDKNEFFSDLKKTINHYKEQA